jgi:hypothetical protein
MQNASSVYALVLISVSTDRPFVRKYIHNTTIKRKEKNTLNLSILTNCSTPTSHISNTLPSKVLANPVKPLLRTLPNHGQARVIVLRPEPEQGGVCEGPDEILFGEGDVWAFEGRSESTSIVMWSSLTRLMAR